MENRYASRIEKVQMSSIRVVMEKVEKLRKAMPDIAIRTSFFMCWRT